MVTKYYLDTCIWRDYFENRSDKFRPLGEWALDLINSIINKKELILYSDFVIAELKVKYSEDEINNMFKIVKDKNCLLKVEISKIQAKEARKLSESRNVAFGDALHAILSKDNNAILVTRDNHFLELQDIAEIKKPEELI